jgi:pimeloyl-ACP methyl ester carboxylesterase
MSGVTSVATSELKLSKNFCFFFQKRSSRTFAVAAWFLLSPPIMADDSWTGAAIMAGGKGYVTTSMGQLHYRDIGPHTAKTPLLLLHQTWMSLVEFAQAQDALSRLGYRSVAVDMPGHGMSDPPPGQPTIEAFADNLLPLLDALHIGRVIVIGHHTGAAIAASFAVRHDDRVAAVVLHGVPYFTQAEIAQFSAGPAFDRTPRADGSHMLQWFKARFTGDPDPPTQANLDSRTWMLISKFFMGREVARFAVFHHDMRPDLLAIRVPTLILTDAGDPIHPADLRAAGLRPNFTYEVFSPYAGMEMMNEPDRWAQVVATYIGSPQQ